MKKIVIISRSFYPANNPRANRTTELAKELARQGHRVTVYAVLGNYDYLDFEKKFYVNVKNMGPAIFSTTNSDGVQKPDSFKTKLGSVLFNKVLEFPDIELSFRVYRVLTEISKKDILITIAVPYPIHWGAAFAKDRIKNFPDTWIADCGDPYMGNPNNKHPFYFKYIEKWFCRKVDYLTVPTQESISAYYSEFHNKIKVIPQGFNFDDYNDLPEYKKNTIPTFIYAGAFYKNIRDPRPFLSYLTTLDDNFKFIIYTRNKGLIEEYESQLGSKLEVKDFVPRKDVIKEFAKADFLINFENAEKVQTPSKIIDYALSNRPILSISHKQSEFIEFEEFLKHKFNNNFDGKDISKFDIKNVANQVLQLNNK
tara:strand:- start:5526 stop:6629 length:1104 start_codon:yes stop_codon:yes gene_type:complete